MFCHVGDVHFQSMRSFADVCAGAGARARASAVGQRFGGRPRPARVGGGSTSGGRGGERRGGFVRHRRHTHTHTPAAVVVPPAVLVVSEVDLVGGCDGG